MVVDTSAIMAILQMESDASDLVRLIDAAPVRLISAVSVLEAGILAEARKGAEGAQHLDAFLHQAALDIIAFDADQVSFARDAFRRYGKGRHSAGLNFGDCAAYALARFSGEPLFFKGNDFGQTDLAIAY